MSRKPSVVEGQRFGKLTAISDVGATPRKYRIWLCRCDCGGDKRVVSDMLVSGKTASCGCAAGRGIHRTVQIGKTFGRLHVLAAAGRYTGGLLWLCRCECGTEKVVRNGDLQSGNTKSCGCLANDTIRERNTTHAMAGTPEYKAWKAMLDRCRNPDCKDYVNYGGRGITVCDEWATSFEAFYAEVGPRPSDEHSIDRIDVESGYRPGNCRWATKTEQNRNRRDNVRVMFRGEMRLRADLCEQFGQPLSRFRKRLELGWSVEDALTTRTR